MKRFSLNVASATVDGSGIWLMNYDSILSFDGNVMTGNLLQSLLELILLS